MEDLTADELEKAILADAGHAYAVARPDRRADRPRGAGCASSAPGADAGHRPQIGTSTSTRWTTSKRRASGCGRWPSATR
ncbi:hypothetical protein HBB16_11985 [Pseudonocardia sp. MCCB 268]|nr:hypothetical protein [Pseudonocardia cytotoxica]